MIIHYDKLFFKLLDCRNNATFDQKKENAGTCMLHQMQIHLKATR